MIKKIKSTEHIAHAAHLSKSSCVLDIETDSRYWRTSHFRNVRLADTEKEMIWIPEKESDEYDLLLDLAESLSRYSLVLTFNGTGFDIPHLRKKYSAYRLSDPFRDIRHDDLFLMLRKYNSLLPIARHRLNDYVTLFTDGHIPEGDAQKELFISRILNLTCLKEGKFGAQIRPSSCPEAEMYIEESPDFPHSNIAAKEDALKYSLPIILTPALPLSFSIHCTDGPFELDSNPDTGTLKLRIRSCGGSFYMYHSDFANYDFLPGEGCAVHKSLTAYVASDRKVKASRENCYTLIPCGAILQGNEKTLIKYSKSAIEYLLSKQS